jgi:hypothetical protein
MDSREQGWSSYRRPELYEPVICDVGVGMLKQPLIANGQIIAIVLIRDARFMNFPVTVELETLTRSRPAYRALMRR